MWPAGSVSYNIDDMPRNPDDLLHYALEYGSVQQIIAPFGCTMATLPSGETIYVHVPSDQANTRKAIPGERTLIAPYDRDEKNDIWYKEVLPVLQAAFECEEPFDKFGSLIYMDFIEFLVNLLWCSRKKMPFVVDMHAIQRAMPSVRDHVLEQALVKDPRPINELLALVNCYQLAGLAYFEPRESQLGSALDIWQHLSVTSVFSEVAAATHDVGTRITEDESLRSLSRVDALVQAAVEQLQPIRALVVRGQAVVSVFREPIARFASAVARTVLDRILGNHYVPPVYCLRRLEMLYNKKYYPEIAESYYSRRV